MDGSWLKPSLLWWWQHHGFRSPSFFMFLCREECSIRPHFLIGLFIYILTVSWRANLFSHIILDFDSQILPGLSTGVFFKCDPVFLFLFFFFNPVLKDFFFLEGLGSEQNGAESTEISNIHPAPSTQSFTAYQRILLDLYACCNQWRYVNTLLALKVYNWPYGSFLVYILWVLINA